MDTLDANQKASFGVQMCVLAKEREQKIMSERERKWLVHVPRGLRASLWYARGEGGGSAGTIAHAHSINE